MLLKFFKFLILVILLGMLIPVIVFNDNVQLNEAVSEKDYKACAPINYNFLFYRCLDGVQQRKARSCESFTQEELKNSCIINTKDEKTVMMNRLDQKRGFSIKRYTPIWASLLGALFFVFMVKGPGVHIHPSYKKMIEKVSEVLPQSDYFAQRSFMTIAVTLLLMGLGLIAFFEILTIFYRNS